MTEHVETVYNVRVDGEHTYFVGDDDWGFALWVHNAYRIVKAEDGRFNIFDGGGNLVRENYRSQRAAQRAINSSFTGKGDPLHWPAGFEPSLPATRLPRSAGRWKNPDTPGEGLWLSDKPAVNEITGGAGVPFSGGRPDFRQWSRGTLEFDPGQLDGTRADFQAVYRRIAESSDFPDITTATQAEEWLRAQNLTPHHSGTTEIQLIPRQLHGNVPHAGSASDFRRQVWLAP